MIRRRPTTRRPGSLAVRLREQVLACAVVLLVVAAPGATRALAQPGGTTVQLRGRIVGSDSLIV